tara:strand:- start:1365 stop:1496 length:132 start_codon:yes stop_codon:yes gene_type:complete
MEIGATMDGWKKPTPKASWFVFVVFVAMILWVVFNMYSGAAPS